MKNLNEAVTKARRTIQEHSDAATQQLLKGCRWLLVKNHENLDADERQRLEAMLAASPELKLCYDLKEDFRKWFQSPDRSTAEQGLADWLARVEASGLKALLTFTRTIANWKDRILNYFDGRYSNGFAEGINLKVKFGTVHMREKTALQVASDCGTIRALVSTLDFGSFQRRTYWRRCFVFVASLWAKTLPKLPKSERCP